MNEEPTAAISVCFHVNTIKTSCLAFLLFLDSLNDIVNRYGEIMVLFLNIRYC